MARFDSFPIGRRIPTILTSEARAQLQDLDRQARAILVRPDASDGDRRQAALTCRNARIVRVAAENPLLPTARIAERLRCSEHVVRRVLHAFNERGPDSVVTGRPGRKEDRLGRLEIVSALQLYRDEFPVARPADFAGWLDNHLGVRLSLSRVRHYLRRAGIRFRGSPGHSS